MILKILKSLLLQPFNVWCPLKGHKYLEKPCNFQLNFCLSIYDLFVASDVKPLSANPTKWPNTLQFPTNCFSVFDHFVALALQGLKYYLIRTKIFTKNSKHRRNELFYSAHAFFFFGGGGGASRNVITVISRSSKYISRHWKAAWKKPSPKILPLFGSLTWDCKFMWVTLSIKIPLFSSKMEHYFSCGVPYYINTWMQLRNKAAEIHQTYDYVVYIAFALLCLFWWCKLFVSLGGAKWCHSCIKIKVNFIVQSKLQLLGKCWVMCCLEVLINSSKDI